MLFEKIDFVLFPNPSPPPSSHGHIPSDGRKDEIGSKYYLRGWIFVLFRGARQIPLNPTDLPAGRFEKFRLGIVPTLTLPAIWREGTVSRQL